MPLAVSAQISIYALRQPSLGPAIDALCGALAERGFAPEVGPMSTRVEGDAAALFAALADGFERAAASGEVVLTVTVSNACPLPRSTGG
jgi:uncharacterized protein YqgV (UPF0045/DUF77 family)